MFQRFSQVKCAFKPVQQATPQQGAKPAVVRYGATKPIVIKFGEK